MISAMRSAGRTESALWEPMDVEKTTMMKMIMGIEEPDEGQVILGPTVKLDYFSQENDPWIRPRGLLIISVIRRNM